PIEPVYASRPNPLWMRNAPPSHRGRGLGSNKLVWNVPSKACDLIGVNAAVPRRLLQRFRFDEALGPGAPFATLGADVRLGRRLLSEGLQACYVPAASVRHHIECERTTVRHLLARRRSVGRSC